MKFDETQNKFIGIYGIKSRGDNKIAKSSCFNSN